MQLEKNNQGTKKNNQETSLALRTFWFGNLAHFLHDGFTDMLYVFFPVWQTQWALSFAQVGLFKMLISGSTALFQIPSGLLAERAGRVRLLLAGTAVTCLAVGLLGWMNQPWLLGLVLVLSGIGSSVQHPLSSSLISDAYTEVKARRTALSAFNFVGDIGKLVLPAAAAFLISGFGWHSASRLLAVCGLTVLCVLVFISSGLKQTKAVPLSKETSAKNGVLPGWKEHRAFWSFAGIGVLDSAVRMAFLTFFPFLLQEKGCDVTTVGFALSLIFAGGAMGKLVCGVLSMRIGILRSVILTESLTALCIAGMTAVSLRGAFFLAPLLGLALNGTSSVLYGSVPELVPDEQRSQAFSVFYTASMGSGAITPSLFGLLGDAAGVRWTVLIVAFVALVTLPLTLPLRGKLVQ